MDSFKRFNKYELPDKEYFYRSLKAETAGDICEKLNADVSDDEYLRCIKIWNKFNMKNMDNYLDYYLKKDVLLLAGVFEKLIDTCLRLLQNRSLSLFWFSWIKFGCDVKDDWCKI